MRALYVDTWREGTHTLSELQALKQFCVGNQITDVFVQFKVDRATVKRHYLANLAGKDLLTSVKPFFNRIHVWCSPLLLYRQKNAIEIAKGTSKIQVNDLIYIDPRPEASRLYVIDQLNRILAKIPRLHLDRFWWPYGYKYGNAEEKRAALTDIIGRVRLANPTAQISTVAFPDGLDGFNDWRSWLSSGYINKHWTMLKDPDLAKDLAGNYNSIVLNIHDNYSLYPGKDIALYSYGVR